MLRKESSVEEKLESIARHFAGEDYLQEDASLYIAARGSLTPYSASTFDLEQGIEEALLADTAKQKVALILGESGSGKSMFGQSLVQKLAQAYLSAKERQGYLPLFISLPMLAIKHRHSLMQETLKHFGFNAKEIEYLKQHQKFFVVLDAYDEIHITENLYRENRLDEWQLKLMMSCKTSYLTDKEGYKSFFMPFKGERAQGGLLKEMHVAPFSATEINSYIEKYLSVKQEELEIEIEDGRLKEEWLKAGSYLEGMEQIPNLKELITNPFLLRITMEVLPIVMQEYASVTESDQRLQMTQAKLYDAFVARWFERQEERLIGLGIHPGGSLRKALMEFTTELARKMHEQGITQVAYEEKSFEEGAEGEWDFFFSDQPVARDKGAQTNKFDPRKQKMRIACRKACLLRKAGNNQYGFIHASLIDYFVARDVFDRMMKEELARKIKLSQAAGISPTSTHSFLFVSPDASLELSANPLLGEKEAGIGSNSVSLSENEGIAENQEGHGQGLGLDVSRELESVIIRYEELQIQRVLGNGSYGIVSKGKYQNGDVAIKQLFSFNPKNVEEFKREAEIMARLRHPHTVILYGVCLEEGRYALVMEYVEKGSLSGVLEKEALSWKIRYRIARDIGAGLAYLHDKGIVHCDLKGLNIFLDANYRAKVGDYGMSAIKRSNAAGEESFGTSKGGSYAYMAPELLDPSLAEIDKEKARNTKAVDVYAYGMVLWEIGARKTPFKGMTVFNLASKVVKGEREEMSADTPSALARLIEDCWQQEPSKRPRVEEAVKYLKTKKEEALEEAKRYEESVVSQEQKEKISEFSLHPKDRNPAVTTETLSGESVVVSHEEKEGLAKEEAALHKPVVVPQPHVSPVGRLWSAVKPSSQAVKAAPEVRAQEPKVKKKENAFTFWREKEQDKPKASAFLNAASIKKDN